MSIYLDNAATSFPKPESVYQAVMHAMREVGASPGRGGHRRSLEAGRIMFQAREAAATLFSAPDSSRIIFTHSATESLNMALRGTLVTGDHVITSSMEHNSLLRPLRPGCGEVTACTTTDALWANASAQKIAKLSSKKAINLIERSRTAPVQSYLQFALLFLLMLPHFE